MDFEYDPLAFETDNSLQESLLRQFERPKLPSRPSISSDFGDLSEEDMLMQ